eukprot:scaffold240088_cov46-Cyclotella_meneghiniana.AAC.1
MASPNKFNHDDVRLKSLGLKLSLPVAQKSRCGDALWLKNSNLHPAKDLHRLDFECQEGWILSARRVKSSVVAPTEESQVSSDCEDIFIHTIAAGLSQCLMVDMMNDVMRSGLECFASK